MSDKVKELPRTGLHAMPRGIWALGLGFATLIAADIILAFAPNLWVVMGGIAIWGLHMGMTQGLLSALVADAAPANLCATAFGVFNFASGIALLLASLIAGVLWEVIGPAATFIAGAGFTALGLSVLLLTRPCSSPAGLTRSPDCHSIAMW